MKRFGFFSLIFLSVLLLATSCSDGASQSGNELDSSVVSAEASEVVSTEEASSSEQLFSEVAPSDEYVSLPFIEF